jgi:hypothetical protein
LVVGSLFVVLSLFLPWWSLNSNIVNGQNALFSFRISPLGIGINTIVGDPSVLFAPIAAIYFIVTILFIPISSSLGLAVFLTGFTVRFAGAAV